MQLKGDTGARKIIQQHRDKVATILFAKGKIDIDTNEDYEALKNS
jgi:CTP:molybdopterin cytidylyltransferase MocA